MKPEIESVNIVLLGSFNPPIFRPDWLCKHQAIGEPEAEAASIEIIHSQIARFRLEWLTLTVEPERLIAEALEPPWIRVKDLISTMFTDLLPHTPIHSMGINRQAHYRIDSQEKADAIGAALAPRDPWGSWAEWIDTKRGNGQKGGLRSLSMQLHPKEDDRPEGFLLIKVEPSIKVTPGVYFESNDHYSICSGERATGCVEIVGLLDTHFQSSVDRSITIFEQVLQACQK